MMLYRSEQDSVMEKAAEYGKTQIRPMDIALDLSRLEKRITDLEAALKPFAAAYKTLLDQQPTPDVAIVNYKMALNRYGDKHHLVQWSDLYRAANLLREKKDV